MTEPLHPGIAPLAFLVGTWSGEGAGEFPTIEPFRYGETLTFSHLGGPFLVSNQRTRDPSSGRPLHTETGYWRLVEPDRVELVLAQPTGIAEVHDGVLTATTVRLRSTAIARTGSAKDVTAVERDLVVDGDVLHATLRMAAVGVPLTHHLGAELHRVG